MKKLIGSYKYVVILLYLIGNTQISLAQYKTDRKNYSIKNYRYQVTDKYHPSIAGVASFAIPGLGQIYCNENKRGLIFTSTYTSGLLLMISGGMIDLSYNSIARNNKSNYGRGMIVGGAILSTSVQIWSIVDAVRVAKFKNMAHRSKNKIGMLQF